TNNELNNDCLCYLSYEGKPVKASRLFAGYEHEEQVNKLAAHFNKHVDHYKTIAFDIALLNNLQHSSNIEQVNADTAMVQQSAFSKRSLNQFNSYEQAYHQLMLDIITQQVFSTNLVFSGMPVQ